MFRTNFLVLYTSEIDNTRNFYELIGGEIIEHTDTKVVTRLGHLELHFVLDASEPIEESKYIAYTTPRRGSILLYIETDNLVDLFEKIKTSKGKIICEIDKRPWSTEEFIFEDPNGYAFAFYKELGE